MDLTVCKILWVKISKKAKSTKEYRNPVFLNVAIGLIVAQNPIIHSIF